MGAVFMSLYSEGNIRQAVGPWDSCLGPLPNVLASPSLLLCTVALSAPDTVLIERNLGKRIDPQTGGTAIFTPPTCGASGTPHNSPSHHLLSGFGGKWTWVCGPGSARSSCVMWAVLPSISETWFSPLYVGMKIPRRNLGCDCCVGDAVTMQVGACHSPGAESCAAPPIVICDL